MTTGQRVRVAVATPYGVRWRAGTIIAEHAFDLGGTRFELVRDDGARMFNVDRRSMRPLDEFERAGAMQ